MAPSHTVISRDGTSIAYDREGDGPPVVLVGGAFQFRAFDPTTKQMAKLLAARGYSVINYDRRGRGESRHDGSMTLADSIADLWAIVTELERTGDAPQGVAMFGNSSGGASIFFSRSSNAPLCRQTSWRSTRHSGWSSGDGGPACSRAATLARTRSMVLRTQPRRSCLSSASSDSTVQSPDLVGGSGWIPCFFSCSLGSGA